LYASLIRLLKGPQRLSILATDLNLLLFLLLSFVSLISAILFSIISILKLYAL